MSTNLAFLDAFFRLLRREDFHRESARSYQLDLADYVPAIPFGSAGGEAAPLLPANKERE